MSNKEVSKLYSCPVIVISVIFFLPLGIYLIYTKKKADKGNELKTTNKILEYTSYSCFLLSLGSVIVLIEEGFSGSNLAMVIYFLIIGIGLFMYSKRLQNNAVIYKKYIAIIIKGKIRSLNEIANEISRPIDVVKKDLNNMIKNNYIEGAYVSDVTNSIVFFSEINYDEDEDENEEQVKLVVCNCCGAKNKVVSSYADCEYCDSPL